MCLTLSGADPEADLDYIVCCLDTLSGVAEALSFRFERVLTSTQPALQFSLQDVLLQCCQVCCTPPQCARGIFPGGRRPRLDSVVCFAISFLPSIKTLLCIITLYRRHGRHTALTSSNPRQLRVRHLQRLLPKCHHSCPILFAGRL